jgi:sec-independent protein translocase protein TatB
MFNIGAGELIVLAVLALILIGPDKLPSFAQSAAQFLQKVRGMANSATAELRENLGPGYEDLQVTDLHPKKFIKKHLDTLATESNIDMTELKKSAQIDPDLL